MDSRICCFILALQIVSCFVSVTSRPFAPNHAVVGLNQTEASLESINGSRHEYGSGARMENGEEYSRGLSKIGSSPPSCEHKCFGCSPCEAIQVTTSSKNHKHLGVQYTNYEPEGWKCKCGSSFYSP